MMTFGLAEHRDQPVPGGVAMMQKKHKSSWRIGYSGAQKKALSRWRRVIGLMTEENNLWVLRCFWMN